MKNNMNFGLPRNLGLIAVSFLLPLALHAKDGASREAFHAAMEACRSENAAKLSGEEPARPGREEQLTAAQKADHAIIEACLTAKGIEKPKRGARPGGPPPPRPAEASESEGTGVN